jgi:hypothetical protein
MATKQSNVGEKRKHSIATSAQSKEKSQKTKTNSIAKEVVANIIPNEKKNAVFYSVSLVFLGMLK